MTPIINDLLLSTSYRGSDSADQLGRVSTTLAPRFYCRSATQPLWMRGAYNPHCGHDSGIRVATVCEEIGGGTSIRSFGRVLRAFGWQCRDVSDHIIEVILIGQCRCESCHLGAINVIGMQTAQTVKKALIS